MSYTAGDEAEMYSCDPEFNDTVIEDSIPEALRKMFERLRDAGIVTIEGRVCCTTCASAEAANRSEELEEEGHDVTGTAFYNEQDLNEEWTSDGREVFSTYDVDSLYVGFGGRGDTPAAAVAGLIMEAAQAAGLEAEWDGSTATKVKVNL